MKITTVDAFTHKPFSGNPAGVCITDERIDETLMQNIAAELNLAETAFLYPEGKGYHLRWFTPTVEIKLCGHATLASAHVLYEQNILQGDSDAIFQTMSGELRALKKRNFIYLDFPAIPTQTKNVDDIIVQAMKENIINAAYNDGGYWVLEFENEEVIKKLQPDLTLLKQTGQLIIATGKSSRYDFVSRVFAPSFGIDEDPVTGAAHCALACYWSEKSGKKEFSAYQASKRGGEIKLEYRGDRVMLIGEAVTVFTGEMRVQ